MVSCGFVVVESGLRDVLVGAEGTTVVFVGAEGTTVVFVIKAGTVPFPMMTL